MNADKQVSLYAPGLLYPHIEWHKKVGVAGQIGTHGQLRLASFDGGGIDTVPQPVRQTQHHVFFPCTARTNCAGVFSAVAGVQRNDDQAVRFGPRALGY